MAGKIALAGAVICGSVGAAATTVPGGVITFIGALVAPPFAVSVGSTAGTHVLTASQMSMQGKSGRTTYVSFVPEKNNSSSADLTLSVAGRARSADALTTSFTDGKGRTVTPGADGRYHVGVLGGTLSMRAPDDAPPGGAQVTLTTNYL